MKRILVFLLIGCLLFLSGCNRSNNEITATEKNAVLIVCGKEPPPPYYVYIDQESKTTVYPLLTVCRGLGAELKWRSKNLVLVCFSDTTYRLNLRKKTFVEIGKDINLIEIAPGGHSGYIKRVEDELLLSSSRITHFITLRGMIVSIDYEKCIIDIHQKSTI